MVEKGERGAWSDHQVVAHLLSGLVPTELGGDIDWEVTRQAVKFKTRVFVDAPSGPWEQLFIEMSGNTHRASSPTVSYFSPHGYVRRLCVNGAHDNRVWTHEHHVTDAGARVRAPAYLSPVPAEPMIVAGTWERVFREFVGECRIVVPGWFTWHPPWEGA